MSVLKKVLLALSRKGGARSQAMQLAGVFAALIVLIIVSAFVSPTFLTPFNLTIMLRSLAFIGIVSIGQAMLLLLGDIDVSVGAVAGLGAVLFATFVVRLGMDPVVGIGLALLMGAGFGAVNGFLITFFGLNALVLTIGMRTVYRGLNLAITEGRTITGVPQAIVPLGAGTIGVVPIPAIVFGIVVVIAWFLTKKTVFGRNLYAVGNSHETARIVGIKVNRVRVIAYAIAGTCASLAGVLMSIRIASAQPSIGEIWLLPSIAAPVIGGIAITGGIGSVWGAVIGGAIMGVVANIIVIGGVPLYWQEVINGAIVVLAVVFDSLTRRFQRRS